MTEPRPVPGPPRPGPGSPPVHAPAEAADGVRPEAFAGLDDRPVSEHVAIYEAEHARLERELGTIDQL
jgi:hypothetical protein